MKRSAEPIEIDMKDLQDLLEALRPRLNEDEYKKLKAAVNALG